MVFEFESLATISAFEAPKDGGFIVGDHMTLKSVDVGEIFLTHLAPLKINTKKKLVIIYMLHFLKLGQKSSSRSLRFFFCGCITNTNSNSSQLHNLTSDLIA